MGLTDDDVREILRIIDEADVGELRLELDGLSLHVIKGSGSGVLPRVAEPPARRATEAPAAPVAEAGEAAAVLAESNGFLTIESPMLGTFYRAEGPGEKPFVDVGTRVEPDTIVCIIEVMKMMNSIPAGVSGTVVEVLGSNAELVEYGQPLFRVQPQ